jgi:phosphoribosylamine---glycine ligase
LGGLVERDPDDKYGLARELIRPLLPWLRKTRFHGPLQVTAIQQRGRWHVIEYNIRIGVTSGPMILRMLRNPIETLLGTARDEPIEPRFVKGIHYGCSLTLAGFGYPFTQVRSPHLPLEIKGKFDCDVWWNEVARDGEGNLVSTGHRIADVIALGAGLKETISRAYANIRKIRVVGSYYRTDVGQSLWPPGKV